jgi:hypothetical protein
MVSLLIYLHMYTMVSDGAPVIYLHIYINASMEKKSLEFNDVSPTIDHDPPTELRVFSLFPLPNLISSPEP